MTVYGISIYLSDLGAAERACADARRQGFELLFTSLHIPEEDGSAMPRLLRELGSIAQRNHLRLVADIAGQSLSALGLTASSAGDLRGWGVHGLRIDDGMPPEQIAELSRALPVSLNASTLDGAHVDALSAAGVDLTMLEAIHNYYPKPSTGLDVDFLTRRNQLLHERRIEVGGFVAADGVRRGPIGRGLPTLEKHRDVHPLAAAIDLAELGADHIYLGDPGLRARSAEQWARYLADQTIDLTVALVGDIPAAVRDRLRHTDTNRPDPGRDLIRLRNSRDALRGVPIAPSNTAPRPIGSVGIDNDRGGRYRGEISIALTDLPADPTTNVLGTVADTDLALLTAVGPDQLLALTVAC
jgi:hypothetical protein